MSAIVWDMRQTARLLPPSEEEAIVIEDFARDRFREEQLRDHTEEAIRELREDMSRGPELAKALFDFQDSQLESELSRQLPNYQAWSPETFQPRILARSIPAIPTITKYIESGITPDQSTEAGERKILASLINGEIELVQRSELVPVAGDLVGIISQEKSKYFLDNVRDKYRHFIRAYSMFPAHPPLLVGIGLAAMAALFSGKNLGNSSDDVYIKSFCTRNGSDSCNYHVAVVEKSANLDMLSNMEDVSKVGDIIGEVSADDFIFFQRGKIFREILEKNMSLGEIGGREKFIFYKWNFLDDQETDEERYDGTSEKKHVRSVEQRLKQVDDFVASNPGKPVSPIFRVLFAKELQSDDLAIGAAKNASERPKAKDITSLPMHPPVLWNERKEKVDPQTGEMRLPTAGKFLVDVYAPWRETLTRNWLRKNDNPLYQALYRQYGQNLHPDFPLPSKKEINDRWIDRVKREGLDSALQGLSGGDASRTANRIAALKSARSRRNEGKS